MVLEDIIAKLKIKFTDIDFSILQDDIVLIPKESLVDVCHFLHHTESLYFDHLACISGFDNHPVTENRFEIVYNLYSIPYEHHFTLKVILEEESSKIPSLTCIWKGANWHEREIFDLFGISFSDHPDLRRILLPANWEGHPLRKDYKTQEYYHGIKVDY